ncbi:MAG: SDR family NAD(P)-dependent oxidoreductase [Betaproteobacteria bacterium]
MSETRASAIVIGTGAIGQALVAQLQSRYSQVLALGRRSDPAIDFEDEASIEAAAQWSAGQCESAAAPLRLLLVSSGFLHGAAGQPERSLKELQPGYLAHSFWVNAIGPALLMKHFLPLLPRQGLSKAVFLSARVGSIEDNRLGGWYGYRAAKAALNQLVKTASIEQSRRNKQSLVLALHPGTVDSPLSAPFGKSGLDVRSPAVAAEQIVQVIEALGAQDTGGFVDYRGEPVPW